jgi:hypothetical protein
VTFNSNGCFVEDMNNQGKLISKGERNGRVTTLLWKSERMTPSLPKWGFQSSISGVKTPYIEAFFI